MPSARQNYDNHRKVRKVHGRADATAGEEATRDDRQRERDRVEPKVLRIDWETAGRLSLLQPTGFRHRDRAGAQLSAAGRLPRQAKNALRLAN